MARSRTGCMTCRKRKLKCDEGRPTCGQCLKANRMCEPSTGITFRHQHNASLNAHGGGSPGQQNQLNSFYNYRESFGSDTIWATLPKGNFIFHHISNPYEDPIEPVSPHPAAGLAYSQDPYSHLPHQYGQNSPPQTQPTSSMPHPHSLHALSQAIELHTPPQANMLSQPASSHETSFDHPFGSMSSGVGSSAPYTTPAMATANRALNIPTPVDPSIDPSLMSPPLRHDPGTNDFEPLPEVSNASQAPQEVVDDDDPERHGLGQKEAILLRHFSETPGRWMDLYDLSRYFSGYVPVQARNHALIRHAACAYAAKQIYLANRSPPDVNRSPPKQAEPRAFIDPTVDWEREGSFHYDQSIILLRQLILEDQSPNSPTDLTSILARAEKAGNAKGVGVAFGLQNVSHDGPAQARLRSDDVVAAAIILGVYEFMSNTGAAWSRHLWGTKSLLDTAMRSVGTSSCNSPIISPRQQLSGARKATFWQFARQDYLAAFINECPTRLDTSNQAMWKEYGLPLTEFGSLLAPPAGEYHTWQGNTMPDDLVSNTLVWLSCKLCNFIAEGEGLNPIPAGDRSETSHHTPHPGEYGISQAILLQKWHTLRRELQVWHNGLPNTFEPTSTYKPKGKLFDQHETLMKNRGEQSREFKATWYASSMCASTMQHYHMAQVLLVLNKPQETTAGRSTIGGRFQSIISIGEEAVYHCYQIVNISLSTPDDATRVHSTQPLFVAGQCFSAYTEQAIVLDLLKGIESDLGWATGYRVRDLKEEWKRRGGWVWVDVD